MCYPIVKKPVSVVVAVSAVAVAIAIAVAIAVVVTVVGVVSSCVNSLQLSIEADCVTRFTYRTA